MMLRLELKTKNSILVHEVYNEVVLISEQIC